jgi:hypothetical protein
MYVSQEAPEQTDARLRRVIAAAELTWHEGQFAFYEFPVQDFRPKKPGMVLRLSATTRSGAFSKQLAPTPLSLSGYSRSTSATAWTIAGLSGGWPPP